MSKIDVCDICGKTHEKMHRLFRGIVCDKCYRLLNDRNDLYVCVSGRVGKTYNRLKAFEELGLDAAEIKSYLSKVEAWLKEEDSPFETVKTQIIGNFEKVSELETTLIFANIDELTNKMQQANVALLDESEKSKKQIKQLEDLKGKEAELTDQINRLNKEIEESNKNTGTLTNENKKLKNQLKRTEKKLKDIEGQKREQGFQDDFSDKSRGWGEYSTENVEKKYEEGEYHILLKKKNWSTWSSIQGFYSDFILEVDARQVSGSVGRYGLIFRKEAGYKYYCFIVDSNGDYTINKSFSEKGGKWETIKAWTESKHIKKGKEINHLKVIAHGSHIMVFVNDEYLATVTDSSFIKGGVGMIVETYDEPNVHVHFDNFKVLPIG